MRKYTCDKQFGMNKKSIVLTASDPGWINGHTYVYMDTFIGATTILLEKPLSLLSLDLMKKILIKFKNYTLFTVTLIRMIKAINLKKNFLLNI